MNILEELKRSYESTYIQTLEPDTLKWVPFYVETINSLTGEILGQIVRSPTSVWEPYCVKYSERAVLLDVPDIGYTNIASKKQALFISVIPERQWKRGVCSRTLSIKSDDEVPRPDFHAPEFIWSLFNREYPLAIPAVAPRDSVAISSKVAIGFAYDSKDQTYLMYCGNRVGFVEDKTFVLYRVYSHLHAYMSKFATCEVE